MRLKPIITACVLAGLSVPILLFSLGRADAGPATAGAVAIRDQARAVLQGKPSLFFHVAGETWLQPVGVYANALMQAAGAGAPGQFASVAAASVNVGLVFLITHAIVGSTIPAIVAAIVLLFTPGQSIAVAEGADAIYPATCILLWLFGVLRFSRHDSIRALSGAALALGVCVYAHPSGPLTAIFLWLLTLAVMWRRNRLRLLVATVVFCAAWLPAAAWFALNPATYNDTFGRWLILAAHVRFPLDAVRAFFNANTLGNRTSFYWGFWDPSWLFFGAEGSRAPLLLYQALFLGAALLRIGHIARDARALVVGAALIVPLSGASFGSPHYVTYAVGVFPLLAVLAGLGADQLIAVITRRKPLEDDVPVVAVDGWDGHETAPRG